LIAALGPSSSDRLTTATIGTNQRADPAPRDASRSFHARNSVRDAPMTIV